MLVIRGTKKVRDRVRGAPAADGEESTTVLGDWFANALFWRPQVALLVNSRTLLPVFMELAPAATHDDRGRHERAKAALRAVADLEPEVDVVVVTQGSVDSHRDVPGTVIRPALKEGKVVYRRGDRT